MVQIGKIWKLSTVLRSCLLLWNGCQSISWNELDNYILCSLAFFGLDVWVIGLILAIIDHTV